MSNTAAMPRGVEAGGVLARIVAYLIDGIPPAIVYGALGLILSRHTHGSLPLVAGIVGALLVLGWAVYVWWAYAVRGTGPGMRTMGLQLVGIRDGRPLGWGRVFLRQLVLSVVTATGIGGILLLVFLMTHPQRQGWHDLAVKSVVVKAPKRSGAGSSGMGAIAKQQVASSSTTTVGLPPRLAQQQGGFAGQTAPGSWQETPAPAGPITSIPGFSGQSGPSASQPSASPYGIPGSPGSAVPASQPSAGYGAPASQAYGAPGSQPSAGYGAPSQGSYAVPNPSAGSQPSAQPAVPPVGQPSAQPPATAPSAAEFGQPFTPPSATYGAPVSQANSGIGGVHSLPSVSQPSASVDPAALETSVLPAGVESWSLTFDDGRVIEVEGKVLVGRDPVAKGGESVRLVAMGEGSKKVSKTHLMVDVDDRGLFLTDRGSTNGTAVVLDNGDFQPCPPGEVVRLADGQGVSFGDHWFTVAKKG